MIFDKRGEKMRYFTDEQIAKMKESVKQELVNGKGTQFDPGIADLMIDIMNEDRDYELREQ